jgi:hypothetical protein
VRAYPTAFVSLLILAAPCLAEPRLAVSTFGHGPVKAGERAAIRWSGLPAGAEEAELLLSLDGGQHFSVRLTESLSPESGFYEWVVPNLSTRDARLALRVGVEGREEISLESDSFEIEPGRSAAAGSTLRLHRGEIWVIATSCGAPPDDGIAPDAFDRPPSFRVSIDPAKEALLPGGAAASCERAARGPLLRRIVPSPFPLVLPASRPAFLTRPLRI